MPSFDTEQLLTPFRRRAEKEADEPGRVRSIAQRASAKLKKHRGEIGALRDDLPVLLRLARAWGRGEYRVIPWRSVLTVVAGLLYFLAPIDAIPDFIPVFGYVDDAAVIAYVIKILGGDIRRFEAWEEEQKAEDAPALLPPSA